MSMHTFASVTEQRTLVVTGDAAGLHLRITNPRTHGSMSITLDKRAAAGLASAALDCADIAPVHRGATFSYGTPEHLEHIHFQLSAYLDNQVRREEEAAKEKAAKEKARQARREELAKQFATNVFTETYEDMPNSTRQAIDHIITLEEKA